VTALALVVATCGGPVGPGLPSGAPSAPGSGANGPASSDGAIGATAEASVEAGTDRPGASPGGASSTAPILGVVDVARLATGETPVDWVEVTSNDDACRQAVPPDWVDSGLPGQVLSPEIHVTSIVANDAFAAWDDHVASLQATYFTDGQEVLVENDRLFLLRSTERGGASHVLALNGGSTACGIVLAIDEAGIDPYAGIGLQILYSLAEVE
jgi:hypothetical protein